MIRKAALISAAVLELLAGCASTQPQMGTNAPAPGALKSTLAAGIALPTINTNGHEISDDVQKKFLAAFGEQATKDGVKVVPNGVPVTLTVEEYNARSTAARVMLGMLSGSDHIKAHVTVGDAKFDVEDTARTAVNGINDVAENVAVQLANGVASLAGQDHAN
ncbi:DUF4410 domain-containing protein [Paraburkholderia youngii]|uniref:DUF4410 domain-containing protein n=1 Tax=Paraburkholderia youngii TaxID=2782701 RepID=UPI003D1FD406